VHIPEGSLDAFRSPLPPPLNACVYIGVSSLSIKEGEGVVEKGCLYRRGDSLSFAVLLLLWVNPRVYTQG